MSGVVTTGRQQGVGRIAAALLVLATALFLMPLTMNADTDGDGLPDGDEVTLYGTNPAAFDLRP